jgi:septum site-determining protein MinD
MNHETENDDRENNDRSVEAEPSGGGLQDGGTSPPATPDSRSPTPEVAATGAEKLAEIIVVTSGKGGVGKTTSSASIAVGLARRGKKVAVIDFDVGLRNLDLILGCERRVVYDFVNVIHGECTLKQALIKDKRHDTLFVLAASQTRDKDALTKEGVERVLTELRAEGFDYIVCDSPAGIEKGAYLAMYFADCAVVVVNPEVSSVRDSDRILGLLASKTRRAELGAAPVAQHLLLTRYNPSRVINGDMMSIDDVKDILGIEVVGVIPESEGVLAASNAGVPVILDDESNAGQAYEDAVARLLGEQRPMRFIDAPKKGLFSRLFGG